MIPSYLDAPRLEGVHLYGEVRFDEKEREYRIEGEPAMLEMAKRVFPGSVSRRSEGNGVRFKATRRAVGDLSWFMQRYPLKLECPERFALDRAGAIEHAERREGTAVLAPVMDPAGFAGTLMPYQGEGVSFLLANRRCLLADDMGLGKTVQALAALAAGNLFPALIVGTASVQRQWAKMAELFLHFTPPGGLIARPPRCQVLKGIRPGPLNGDPLVVCHYGLLRGWHEALKEHGFRAVIFDECQELRKGASQKYSAASLLSSEVDYVWGLSGTPIYNYGAEMWSVLNVLDFHCLGDIHSFEREWCAGFRSEVVAKPAVLGDHLKREGLMLRRTKDQVQSQLPAKRRVVSVIGHEEDRYGKLIAEAVTIARGVKDIKEWNERGQAVRQVVTQARRATGEAKAPMVADFVRTLMEAGEKVLLFLYHHSVVDEVAEALAEFKPAMVTGRESPAEKAEGVAAFAEGKTGLAVLSLRTTAGIDGLQGRGTCVVFGELDWSPAVHAQCEDRLHRIGLKAESVLCYYLVTDTGSDEVIQEALGLKVGQFVGLMGDASPTDEQQELAGREAQKHIEGIVAKLAQRRGRKEVPC